MGLGGGGKGGSQSTSVKLPQFVEDAASRAIDRGEAASQIGFVPFSGPEVAAFTPQQELAFAATNQAAEAFGLPAQTGTGLPAPQDFGGGVMGFSSRPVLDFALGALEEERPGQFAALQAPFIDPVTGELPLAMGQPVAATPGAVNVTPIARPDEGAAHNPAAVAGGGTLPGGFTGFRDMFDGGGAGASGDRFQGGGLISDIFNAREDRLDRAGRGGLL